MPPFEVNIRGLAELNKALYEIGSKSQLRAATAGTAAAAAVFRKAGREGAPQKTGRLSRSVIAKKTKSTMGGYIQYIVGPAVGRRAKNDGWYGRLVEHGTKAHVIRLRKKTRKAGHHGLGYKGRFGQIAHHPGARKKPWLAPSFERSYGRAIDAFAKAYARIALKLGAAGGSYVGVDLELTSGV